MARAKKAANGFPPSLRPRLFLFLSADVVGGTALKQANSAERRRTAKSSLPSIGASEWFNSLQAFYVVLVQKFEEAWNDAIGKARNRAKEFGEEPELWKTVGDEVLFWKELTHHCQVDQTLVCWLRAVDETRKFLRMAFHPRLDLKCTAWTGLFPIRNERIVITTDNALVNKLASGDFSPEAVRQVTEGNFGNAAIASDFVGPAIDIGFRLAKLSTSRKFAISLDVAYMTALSQLYSPKIHYDGRFELKGVLGGISYPFFWIDTTDSSSLDQCEDRLLPQPIFEPDDVIAFAEKFYDDNRNALFTPFILSDQEDRLTIPPPGFLEEIRERARRIGSS